MLISYQIGLFLSPGFSEDKIILSLISSGYTKAIIEIFQCKYCTGDFYNSSKLVAWPGLVIIAEMLNVSQFYP